MINKIIECENRLLQDRKMLNDLLRMEYNRYLQAQAVNRPQQEAFVPQQAAFVSQPQPVTPQQAAFVAQLQPVTPQPRPAEPQPQRVVTPPQGMQNLQPQRMVTPPSGMQNPQPQWQGAPLNPAMMYQRQAPKKTDVEKTIGKSLMGIFASILIFVSLILFATLVVPYLTDAIKMILMFGVSFAFAIIGNLLLIKNPKNKWFLSLAGCGVGAVYLSLFISRLYFNAITDFVLYGCILVWAILVSILSKLCA